MNEDRHRLKIELTESLDNASELLKMKDKGLLDIQRLNEDMKVQQTAFATYQ